MMGKESQKSFDNQEDVKEKSNRYYSVIFPFLNNILSIIFFIVGSTVEIIGLIKAKTNDSDSVLPLVIILGFMIAMVVINNLVLKEIHNKTTNECKFIKKFNDYMGSYSQLLLVASAFECLIVKSVDEYKMYYIFVMIGVMSVILVFLTVFAYKNRE